MTIDDQLRRLDPANAHAVDLSPSSRAMQTMAQVMSAEPGRTPTRSKRGRRTRYALAAALAGVGVVAAPVLGGGTAAFAGWDQAPRTASSQEIQHWGNACSQSWTESSTTFGEGRHDWKVQLVELRGPWAFTLLQAPDDYLASCLATETPLGEDTPTMAGISYPLKSTPAPNGLVTKGVQPSTDLPGTQYTVMGKVGPDVRAISFHINGTQVKATITDGTFAAWWPEIKPDSVLQKLTSSESPTPDVTIALKDGTSRVASIQDFRVHA
jgi:hypothetical protein